MPCIQVSIETRNRKVINLYPLLTAMAIPFWTGEEEREEDRPPRHNPQQSEEEDASIGGGSAGESEDSPSSCSFLGQLVKELAKVYEALQQKTPRALPTPQGNNPSARRRRRRRNQEAQSHPSHPLVPQQPLPLPLPDLITSSNCCCHVQAIHPRLYQNLVREQRNSIRRYDGLPLSSSRPARALETVDDDVDSDPSGLSLDIKMQIDISYRRIGQGLRQIADEFEQTRGPRTRTRHPAGQHKAQFNFTLKVVIPVTFLGLSLALLRRN